MFTSCIVMTFGLLVGDGPGEDTPATTEAPTSSSTGLLMKSLEPTLLGAWLSEKKISISGWTEGSFTGSSASYNQLPMGFNYLANNFLLQQNWLRIEKSIDEKSSSPSWGFRSDTILPGSDYRFTVARGLWDSQLTDNQGSPATYGIDPVQFYGEVYLPQIGAGLDIKLGRFFAQFGVESIDTTQNQLASRSYTFIYDPFTNTGLLTTLKLNDTWSIQNGLALGSDVFIDPAATPTYLGSIKWAPPKGDTTVLFSTILGCGRYNTSQDFNNPQIFDLVVTHKLSEKWNYTLEALYGFQDNVPDIGFANWFGIVNYLTYQMSDKLSTTARLEFFDDIQGQRTGYRGLYTTATWGFHYKPNDVFVIRPEVRFDHNDVSRPFENAPSLLTVALDVIVRW